MASYDWKGSRGTITAPEGNFRMSLFFGLRSCKGEMDFDDININTASEKLVSSETEILGPRCRWPRSAWLRPWICRWLSTAAWPTCGISRRGEQRFGGVLFKIPDGPKSVVVLKSTSHDNGDLPEKVAIPVGRKFDTLFFLHSGVGVQPRR